MTRGESVRRRVPEERVRWAAPGLGLADLGLASSAPLFAPGAELSARIEELERAPRRTRVRFPLPGTSDARGNLTGRPGALGTGWLWLTAYRASVAELLRARLTPPRSASLGEREWNLLCHLRAHGVGTPEPLLVGARGNGLASARSFLLVRAPENAQPLPRWVRTLGDGAERARGLEALGRALLLVRRAGVELPELAREHVWLTPGGGAGECDVPLHGSPEGPRRNRLPGVLVVRVDGGRIGAPARHPGFAGFLASLAELLAPDERARVGALSAG